MFDRVSSPEVNRNKFAISKRNRTDLPNALYLHGWQTIVTALSARPHFIGIPRPATLSNLIKAHVPFSSSSGKVKTPTLNFCGALDRCTPPSEAMQFHRALLESGVKSVLVTYPEEGHGVRNFPAAIDYAARVAAWFTEHMLA